MSKKYKKIYFKKSDIRIKSVNKFKKNNIIKYENDKIDIDFLEMMKEGYKEMSKINLEFSQLPFECELADIREYENWLCGV
ncbi:hypothetical protein [Clostridium isatidis]|uniref:Uncharacterized protein n=1 Tax=Clostridium isatidis TaxID=182773 RepID=A0A343JFF9_9CLOT|nr:hypothetical protein [Clostridium isatidis]ASW44267.1 hypothetical protein BEN51_12620 [Clostridium isatidis]NLZ34942.1 hypothetical protein [Clostridiales bacterium]